MRVAGTLRLDGTTLRLNQGGNHTELAAGSPAGDITLTLPSTTDTLVGRDTTDTLTNKDLTAPTITGGSATGLSGSFSGTFSGTVDGTFDGTLSGDWANDLTITTGGDIIFEDEQLTITADGAGIEETATTISIPSMVDHTTDVFVLRDTAQTLTLKTLTAPKLNENVALSATSTKLNFLATAAGTTGNAGTNLVFSNTPTLTTPVLGVATATSINKVTITAPGTSATLTLATGSTLATSGANSITLTSTGATNVTLPTSGTLAVVGNSLAQFASTTSLELKTLISDETGSGALVFANTPTLVTPVLGAATATSINGLTLTASTGTLTLVNGSSLITAGAFATTLTSTNTTNVTLPTTGTLATLAGSEDLTNKTLTSPKLNENVVVTTTATKLNYLTSATGTTGTASTNIVFSTSPTLVTPVLGAATATSVNGLTITSTTGTLTLANSSSLITSGANSVTLTSTGTTNATLPSGTTTLASRSDKLSVFAATTSAELAGVISDETGSNKLVFSDSPTLLTPLVDDYLQFNEESAPSTPASGKGRLYATTTGKLKYINDDGITVEMGSSSGSGEKNYVTNPSGVADVAAAVPTGWANVGDLDIVVTKTASDLPREYTTASGFKITADSNTQSAADYVYYDFTLDDVDLSKKLKIEWSQKTTGTYTAGQLEVVITTQADRTTALHTPATAAIPAADGVFTTTFDAGTTATLSLVIRATADMTTDGGIVISDLVVGPGSLPLQGAAVGDWQSDTATITASGGGSVAIGTGGNAVASRKYRRVGDSLEVSINWLFGTSGTSFGTSGNYRFGIPTGLTVDSSKLGSNAGNYAVIGNGVLYDASASDFFGLNVIYNSASAVIEAQIEESVSGATLGTAAPVTLANSDGITVRFTVPISEWSGSGTLNLGANQVEYASWNGSATVYGTNGSPVVNTTASAVNTRTTHTITWQQPVQATDRIWLEINGLAGQPAYGWTEMGAGATDANIGISRFQVQSVNAARYYGIGWRYNNSTSSIIEFGDAGMRPDVDGSSTYGGVGNNWDNTIYYRLCKASAGQAVGFGLATSGGAAGLVNPYTVGSGVVYAGTYTPVGTTNDAAKVTTANITESVAQYMRVGSVVTVSGKVVLNAAAAGLADFYMTLPVTSNLASTIDCCGTANNVANSNTQRFPGTVSGDGTNNAARFLIEIANVSDNTVYYTYTYLIT